MPAAVITRFGPPEEMKIRAVPDPVPAAGQVPVQVHARGRERSNSRAMFVTGAIGLG
jgi:NADPH:quinone reductase-like Zn-dependent oxidoreductase